MRDRIREAFAQVQAGSELKDRTKAYIYQKTKGYRRARDTGYKRLACAFACLALVLLGGYWTYFTPTVEISIDVNPSIELGVNRFNRVVSLKSWNEDGRELLQSLDIKYMEYSQAVDQIMESEAVASLLSNGEVVAIAVIGTGGAQSEEILTTLQSRTAGQDNAYCYSARAEEVEAAHALGLSYGKYRAYLELQALDSTVTADDIQNMTMREIRDRIGELSTGEGDETHPHGDGGSGNGNGNDNGNGNGQQNRWGRQKET